MRRRGGAKSLTPEGVSYSYGRGLRRVRWRAGGGLLGLGLWLGRLGLGLGRWGLFGRGGGLFGFGVGGEAVGVVGFGGISEGVWPPPGVQALQAFLLRDAAVLPECLGQ